MYKSNYIRGNEATKIEYKKFASNLTKMKTFAKKNIRQMSWKIVEETLEKRGSYFAHCFQESHIVL